MTQLINELYELIVTNEHFITAKLSYILAGLNL